MAEKISDLIQKIEKDSSSTKEQKEKARKVLELLKAKNKWSLIVSAGSRQAILWLLTETTLDANISAEAIWDNLSQASSSPWASGNLDLWSQDATDDWSWEMGEGDDEIDMEAENFAEQLSRQWWDDVYIVAKMISLWYMPKVHSMNHTKKWYNPIKWVWANKWYLIVGWLLTNWHLNWKSASWQKSITDWFLKMFTWEETQLKILLNQLKTWNINWGIEQLRERKNKLEELNKAIISWDKDSIKKASKDYSDISEKTWKISDLYKKYWVKEKVEVKIEDKWQKDYDVKEQEIKADRKAIIDEIDRQIWEVDIDRQNSVTTEENNRSKLTSELDDLEDDLKKLKRRKAKKADIDKVEDAIIIKNREIRDYKPSNTIDLANYDYKKWFLQNLRSAVDSWDHKITSELLSKYKGKTKTDFKFGWGLTITSSTGISPEAFITSDQKEVLDKARESWKKLSISEQKKLLKWEKSKARIEEVVRINAEVKKIEDEINRIREEAEKQAKKLDKIAKEHPEKIPELKAEIEKTVWDYNTQIIALEKAWVDNLQQLSLEDLKKLETKSPWTKKIIKANEWIDGFLWKTAWGAWWKIIWVMSMILLWKGVWDWASETWVFTKETLLNVTDIWIWIIPVVWGAYDLWRWWEWTDLNWVEMTESEKRARLGFWVLWLIPVVWTAVKWSSTFTKSVNIVIKTSRITEAVVQWWNLAWKVVSLWYLWYGWLSTAYYALD